MYIIVNHKSHYFWLEFFHKKCRCLCKVIAINLYKSNYIIEHSHKYLNTKMFRICVQFYGPVATKPIFSEKYTK